MTYDVAVIGGGPAGSAAAITAARAGAKVLMLDRDRFPRHKVCGEFVSQESLGTLRDLLADRFQELTETAPAITRAEMFVGGRILRMEMEHAALSISRYLLDAALWDCAKLAGAEAREGVTVTGVSRDHTFQISTREGGRFFAHKVINAAGKWSELSGVHSGKRWLGLKAHFRGPSTPATVALHFFESGYCGVQPVGDGLFNVSALVREGTAKSMADIFDASSTLKASSRSWQQATDTFSTFPVHFGEPLPVRDEVLQAGDAAGFLDPFVGDGISMALQSGVMAAQAALQHEIVSETCIAYETAYRARLMAAFRNAARLRSLLFGPGSVRDVALAAARIPGILPWLMRATRARVA